MSDRELAGVHVTGMGKVRNYNHTVQYCTFHHTPCRMAQEVEMRDRRAIDTGDSTFSCMHGLATGKD